MAQHDNGLENNFIFAEHLFGRPPKTKNTFISMVKNYVKKPGVGVAKSRAQAEFGDFCSNLPMDYCYTVIIQYLFNSLLNY